MCGRFLHCRLLLSILIACLVENYLKVFALISVVRKTKKLLAKFALRVVFVCMFKNHPWNELGLRTI